MTAPTTANPPSWPAHQRAYWTAWVATLIFFGGFYTLLVPLPRYLERIGLPDWQVGLILGIFGLASTLGRTPSGVGVDRWGTRPMLLLGSATLVVSAVGVLATTSPLLLGGLRLLHAAGYVAFTTAGFALVIEATPLAERGRRLAVFGVSANLAITLAPALTNALLEVAPLEAGFWLGSGLALLAGLLVSLVGTSRANQAARPAAAGSWTFPRRLWLPMLLAGLFGAGFAAFFLFAPILGERRGVSAGLLYTCYGIGIIATRLIGSRWLDRAGPVRSLLLSAALLGGGLSLAAVATSDSPLALAALLIAAGCGIFHPVLIALHAHLLPGAPGQATAGFYVGFDLGIGLGSWLFGLALQLGGLSWLYASAALVVALTVPLLRPLSRPPEAP